MKSYIGIKAVQAEPEERDGQPGYAVVYADGYRSWSPAAAFEDAYFDVPGDRAEAIVDTLVMVLGGIDALINYEPGHDAAAFAGSDLEAA